MHIGAQITPIIQCNAYHCSFNKVKSGCGFFVTGFPDQHASLVNKKRGTSLTPRQTGHLNWALGVSAVVYNGSTGVHGAALCRGQTHAGGLVRQVWSGSLLFTPEGDVANYSVIMKIPAAVVLLHLYLSLTGELMFQVTQVSLKHLPDDVICFPQRHFRVISPRR